MKFTRLKSRLKGTGSYIALAICMIGIGACGWLTVGKSISEDTADADSVSSLIIGGTSSYNDTVKAGTVVSGTVSEDSSLPETEQTAAKPASSNQSVSSAEAVSAEYFVLPLTGEILKPFSLKELQYSATFADWRLHNGLDIAADSGTIVHSASDGTVADVYDDEQYGKVIKISHGNGVTTVYCGLGTAYVKKGDSVGINQDIGTVGEIPCESADSSHLHFAAIKDGMYISPLEMVNME